jgi:malate dehydrogenase (oxaloacetate-decarboxylating)
LAAIINALKLIKKDLKDCTVTFSGAGAAGVAIAKLLAVMGAKDLLMCDRKGIISRGDDSLPEFKKEIASYTNTHNRKGSLADALVGADIFVGVSGPGVVTEEMVKTMAPNAIVMAMANPVPEILPDLALAAGAAVVGTGRSDFPNQINNVLAFPGIFRGALDVRASDINEEMKIAAAFALASLISDDELNADYIIPRPFDKRVGDTVAAAVAEAARKSGVARI